MADIPLRTYVQQLDNLIERKQIDEVLAHCRHILSLYPKHLDTYRMLGKALLEKGRHGDAADIFQRVLSVMPDDFISHVGMSIVREDEANLDAAIWHMERAFEAAPANGAIQQELCRLFGRRDGVAPTKARLTRGALARMYAQGGLYLQAEAELKAALAAEADRIDLLTKLAEVYWQTDQPAQAAQTSTAILQKLPYSLEANRILVNVFRAQGRATDAQVYRQRLEAIDPYEAFADPQANGAGAARVDPAKVMVARLEYVPGMEDSGSPDWLASIGAKFEDQASTRAADTQPEWLSGANAAPAPAAADYLPGQSSVPDWLKDLETGPAAASAAQMSEPPDWLKDIGDTPAQPAAPAGSNENLPDWLTSSSGPLAADAVPDWMLKATSQADDFTGEAATATQTGSPLADVPLPAAPLAEARSTAPLPPLEPAGEVPDWLKATAAGEADEDLPDWLKAITAQPLPAAQTPPADAPTVPVATSPAPALMENAAPAEPQPADMNTAPLPDWLYPVTGQLDPTQVAQVLPSEPEAAEADTTPVAAAAEAVFDAPDIPAVPAAKMAAAPATEAEAPTSLADLPDWLKAIPAMDATTPVADAVEALPLPTQPVVPAAPEPTPAEPGLDMPDWLKNEAPVEQAAATGEEAAALPASGDELPDWLQTAAATPAARDETPVWLQTAPAAPSLLESAADQEPEPELPDWLKDLTSGTPPEAAAAQPLGALGMTGGTEAPAAPKAPVDLPDYLQLASPEAIARAEQPIDLEPEAAEPEEEEPVTALPAEIPEWLKALAPVSPDLDLPDEPTLAPATAEASAAAEPGDSLSWMDELTALGGPLGEAVPQEPPTWVAGADPPASSEPPEVEPAHLVAGGLAEDTLAGEIPPWAQNDEPGPSDTIASWLAGKHVPDWLRQPANDAPGLPAVEWEPNAAEAAAEPAAVDSLAAAEAEPPAPAEPTPAAAPDLESMDPEAAFRWLESLAAQQGANRDELFTLSAEPAAAEVETPLAQAPTEPVNAPTETETAASARETPERVELEAFLQQTEAALPIEPILDTAPSKNKAVAPAADTAAESDAEPLSSELDTDAAMRWLEGLAAQQGAKPEELITTPEERTLEAPQWVAAEAAASETQPPAETVEPSTSEAAPVETIAAETMVVADSAVETAPAEAESIAPASEMATPESPAAEPALSEALASDADEEAALRWLEGLAAQQGARPEELLTAPEERTLETPAWITAQAAAETAQPAAEASPAESVAATPEPAVEPEPELPAEPEPALAPETPEWLAAAVTAEDLVETTPAAPAEPAAPMAEPEAPVEAPPPATGVAADLEKLSRLAERLGAARRAREAEMEARFAEQRRQQEEARRWVEERMETKRSEPEPEPAAPEPAIPTPVAAVAPLAFAEAPAPVAEPVAPVLAAPEVVSPMPSAMAAPSAPPEAAPTPPASASEALAAGQAALAGRDYAAAVTHFSALVKQGHHLDTVVQSLAGAAEGGQAPSPLLRVLGDAYVRTDQLQQALDTYRQALRRL